METKPLTKILVVEDEGITAKALEVALTDMGYLVVGVASTAWEAIEQAAHWQPNLVLMDIRLKGLPDGVFTAQQIQDRMDIPVIYLTALSDDETQKRAIRSKPHGYLIKPFTPEDLRHAIDKAFEQHRQEQSGSDES
jgi:CheY-like chemotaxis protein